MGINLLVLPFLQKQKKIKKICMGINIENEYRSEFGSNRRTPVSPWAEPHGCKGCQLTLQVFGRNFFIYK